VSNASLPLDVHLRAAPGPFSTAGASVPQAVRTTQAIPNVLIIDMYAPVGSPTVLSPIRIDRKRIEDDAIGFRFVLPTWTYRSTWLDSEGDRVRSHADHQGLARRR